MPNIVVLGLACALLCFVFPRAFKVFVGAFVGGSVGMVVWSVATLAAATTNESMRSIVHGFTAATVVGALVGIIIVSRSR